MSTSPTWNNSLSLRQAHKRRTLVEHNLARLERKFKHTEYQLETANSDTNSTFESLQKLKDKLARLETEISGARDRMKVVEDLIKSLSSNDCTGTGNTETMKYAKIRDYEIITGDEMLSD
ncbi:hypothetical protein EDC01DRAFT_630624 [Geopyxis carbonaria]|nr:hypothetical protein EDC01DRAFT_630624 [Geopyxis carbonaria]